MLLKRVRDNKSHETSRWQWVYENFSHMRAIKYICHYFKYIMFVHAQSEQQNAEGKLCWAL